MACLHLAHFTLVGRHRMLQRVSLEAGQWPTIFRKRRFLGLEWSGCMPVFSLPEEQRFEGLGNSGPNLVNWLALWATPVATLWLLLLHQRKSQNQPHFTWFVKTPQVDFIAHLILLSDVLSRPLWTLKIWTGSSCSLGRLQIDFQADRVEPWQFLCHWDVKQIQLKP